MHKFAVRTANNIYSQNCTFCVELHGRKEPSIDPLLTKIRAKNDFYIFVSSDPDL